MLKLSRHLKQLQVAEVSPAAWGVCLFFVSFLIPYSRNIPIFLLAILGVIISFTETASGTDERKNITRLIIIFLLITIVSIIFSKNMNRSIFTSLPLEPAILIFFLIAYFYRGQNDLIITFTTLYFISMGIISLLLITALLNLDKFPLDWVKLSHAPLMVVPNDISFVCIIAPLILGVCHYFKRKSFITICYLSFLCVAITASMYRSAVGLICMFSSLFCYFLFTRKHTIYLLLLLIPLLVLIDFLLGKPLFDKIILTLNHKGWDPRIALWLAALGMFKVSPIYGYGPHTYVYVYRDFIDDLNLPAWLPLDTRTVPWAHNLYLEMIGERGLLGFLSFIAIIIASLFCGYRLIKKKDDPDRFLLIGVYSAMIGFCIGAMLEFTFLRLWVVLLFFTLVGCMIQPSFKIEQEREEVYCAKV